MSKIKNIDKASQRIKKAIKEQENIILFSDADLDGTASLMILEEAIKTLGGKIVLCYFPDREKQGYGLSDTSLKQLKKYSPGLLILSDSGIANFEEVKIAKEMGLKTIIIDHHEILGKLPSAEVIIDPKQTGDTYPFKFLAACGLCFRLAQTLLGKQLSKNMEKSFLELVALGTIADMMPVTDDNQELIAKGLSSLLNSLRPGIRVFLDIFSAHIMGPKEFAQKIISVLQLTDFEGNLTESYLLLSSCDLTKAQSLAEILFEKSQDRHQRIRERVEQIAKEAEHSVNPMIFKHSTEIHHLLTGSIASKICNKFKKPSFIIASKQDLSRGSVRSPKNINCLEALTACSSLLKIYGGHPQAAGFSIENENLEKLKKCLLEHFK